MRPSERQRLRLLLAQLPELRRARPSFEPINLSRVVVAGSHEQFRQYCQRLNLNPRELHYAPRGQDLRAMRGSQLIRIGTWYTKDDVVDTVVELKRENFFAEIIDDHV
jgi:hypothetical protein